MCCHFFFFFFPVCSRFFEWPFFLKSLNLAKEGHVNINSADSYQSCQVVPGSAAYYKYQLGNKWMAINQDIFKVEEVQGKLVFKVMYPGFISTKSLTFHNCFYAQGSGCIDWFCVHSLFISLVGRYHRWKHFGKNCTNKGHL